MVATAVIQRMLVFPAVDVICHPRVSGAHWAAQLTGPCVVVANHASHLDCPVVLRALPAQLRRRIVVPAAADYFYSSKLRGLAVHVALGTIPFERHGDASESLRRCQRVLAQGGAVLIFPEGTRSRDGRMGRCRRGAARIALAGRVPVLPVGLHGLHEVLPVGASRPHRGPASVRFGEPLMPRSDECERGVTDRIAHALRQLATEMG